MSRSVCALALVSTCLSGLPAAAEDAECERRIAVVGRAEASHAPDYIALTLASDSKASTVAGALEASGKAMTAVSTLAQEFGVPQGDVRTVSVVIEEATRTVSRTLGADQREPDGFRVSNQVSIRLTERSRAGDFVRRTLDKGGIRIELFELGLDDSDRIETALLVAAGKDARARASALAEAAGASAGIVCSLKAGGVLQTPPLSEPTSQPRKKKFEFSRSYDATDGRPGLFVPLQTGTIDLFVEVSAEFAARP